MRNVGKYELEFNARVQKKVQAGMARSDAVVALVREDPALHLCFLSEHNDRLGYTYGALQARKALAAL
ncbi:MAG: hypothetical protein IIA66_12350 [Planctomycetes bacterium]|nr:hypothetical protein [Planctomycetota bacterium]